MKNSSWISYLAIASLLFSAFLINEAAGGFDHIYEGLSRALPIISILSWQFITGSYYAFFAVLMVIVILLLKFMLRFPEEKTNNIIFLIFCFNLMVVSVLIYGIALPYSV